VASLALRSSSPGLSRASTRSLLSPQEANQRTQHIGHHREWRRNPKGKPPGRSGQSGEMIGAPLQGQWAAFIRPVGSLLSVERRFHLAKSLAVPCNGFHPLWSRRPNALSKDGPTGRDEIYIGHTMGCSHHLCSTDLTARPTIFTTQAADIQLGLINAFTPEYPSPWIRSISFLMSTNEIPPLLR
jgi:hypothetical protein